LPIGSRKLPKTEVGIVSGVFVRRICTSIGAPETGPSSVVWAESEHAPRHVKTMTKATCRKDLAKADIRRMRTVSLRKNEYWHTKLQRLRSTAIQNILQVERVETAPYHSLLCVGCGRHGTLLLQACRNLQLLFSLCFLAYMRKRKAVVVVRWL